MHPIDKPSAPACERNRDPILVELREHFAHHHPVPKIAAIRASTPFVSPPSFPISPRRPPIGQRNSPVYGLTRQRYRTPRFVPWTSTAPDRISADRQRQHPAILAWPVVERLVVDHAGVLTETAKLVIYGPFNYGGRHTSESNTRFEAMLRAEAALQGCRNFETVAALACGIDRALREDRAMPTDRCQVWQRVPADVLFSS